MMWWGKAKSRLNTEDLIKQNVSEADYEKLKNMEVLYDGVKKSISNGVALAAKFAREFTFDEVSEKIEECGNKDTCPVNSFVTKELCKDCNEKPCKDRQAEGK